MTIVSDDRRAQKGKVSVPFSDPLSSLPETARKILDAARRLLSEQGYQALTLENVAAAGGVNKASIRYNFGNKAGLISAVAAALIHDECLRVGVAAAEADHDQQVHEVIADMEQMLVGTDSMRGFFDILPHAMRDPELRLRLAALYPWWYERNLMWFGLDGRPASERDELLTGFAELIAAIPDGLAVQAGLNPEGFDLRRPLRALEFLLQGSIDDLRAIAAGESSGAAGGADGALAGGDDGDGGAPAPAGGGEGTGRRRRRDT